tara:strand:- start:524 stop:1921 length:1398 start_codon:yes stop_codon:yes gene_type:complete
MVYQGGPGINPSYFDNPNWNSNPMSNPTFNPISPFYNPSFNPFNPTFAPFYAMNPFSSPFMNPFNPFSPFSPFSPFQNPGPPGGGMPNWGWFLIGVAIGYGIGCFKKGTKITMADGTEKNIEDIKVGDIVKSYDEDTGKLSTAKVSALTDNKKVSKYYLINNTLAVTDEHPFYINYREQNEKGEVRSHGEWVKVKDLKEGTNLTTTYGGGESLISTSYIQSIEEKNDVIEVFNFEVEGTHTYFADGILVHNKGPGPGGGPYECFVAGTKVTMKDGPDVSIEDIKVGDEVLSYNVHTQQFEPKQVTDLITQNHDLKDGDITVKITYDNGNVTHNTIANPFWSKDKGFVAVDEERCNRIHPWVIDTNGGMKVESLTVGDVVYQYDDEGDIEEVKVTDIEYVMEEGIRTYDITVEDNHTFFANGILTHNSYKQGQGAGPAGYGGVGPSPNRPSELNLWIHLGTTIDNF